MQKHILVSFKIVGLSLALLWLFQATTAEAKIYKWRDDSGKLHFTDNASKIPKKYRDKMEKFKGAPPPPTTQGADDGEEPGEGSEGSPLGDEKAAETAETVAPPPAVEEAKPESQFTGEELALLKETYKVLMTLREGKINFFNIAEPTAANGDKYVKAAHSLGKMKKEMSKKIVKPSISSLKEAKTYLKKSASRDRMVRTGTGSAFEGKIKKLRRRMEKELVLEKKIIEMLRADLGIEAPPLESLKDIKEKIAKAKGSQRAKR